MSLPCGAVNCTYLIFLMQCECNLNGKKCKFHSAFTHTSNIINYISTISAISSVHWLYWISSQSCSVIVIVHLHMLVSSGLWQIHTEAWYGPHLKLSKNTHIQNHISDQTKSEKSFMASRVNIADKLLSHIHDIPQVYEWKDHPDCMSSGVLMLLICTLHLSGGTNNLERDQWLLEQHILPTKCICSVMFLQIKAGQYLTIFLCTFQDHNFEVKWVQLRE